MTNSPPLTPRILVIEDEASVRSLLDRILSRENFTVLFAANGRDGYKMVQAHPPDVLILDLHLPDISGELVCQMIRKDPATQGLPILVLTGLKSEGLAAACLNGGADDYLEKPFDIKELVARLKALLRRRSL